MASKLSTLLRQIFYSSVASIAATNSAKANSEAVNSNALSNYQPKVEILTAKKTDLTPKLILKRSINNDFYAVSHRSHRSHSSHRSHYSSSSGGGYTPSSTPRKTPVMPAHTPPKTTPTPPSKDKGLKFKADTLHLGDRTLKLGMTGTDVTELVNILRKKWYLVQEGDSTATGIHKYDSVIEAAVKKFQLNHGLTSNGICDPTTIYYLKKKQK